MFTGMKYFLDNLGFDICQVQAGFNFYSKSYNNVNLKQKIEGQDAILYPGLGCSMSTTPDGDLLLVGSLNTTSLLSPVSSRLTPGRADVYTLNNCKQFELKQTFYPSALSGDFGLSVCNNNDGSVLVIGSPSENLGTGCIHIYTGTKNNGWELKQVISGNSISNQTSSAFGFATATNHDGSIIAVGTPYDQGAGLNAGSAIIFTGNSNNGWNFSQRLTGNALFGSRVETLLGTAVSLNQSGDILIIGNRDSSFPTIASNGIVWIYTGNNNLYDLKQVLSGSGDADVLRRFGASISNNHDASIIVVSQRNGLSGPSGAFWIYTGSKTSNYIPVQKFLGRSDSANIGKTDPLPVSMNRDGSVFLAGLPYLRSASQSGILQVYTGQNNRWALKDTISGAQNNRLGYSNAISSDGTKIFAGAPGSAGWSRGSFSYYNYAYAENTILPEPEFPNSSFGSLNIGRNNFLQNLGTGFFNGSTVMKLSDPYIFENDTILLSYEKLRTGDEILLSSVTGNSFSTYSGFCLGVNDANKLYFKYWNPVEGPFSFTYTEPLANKNLLLLNKNNNILTIGNLNNNTQIFELETFFIKNNAFVQGRELFLGGMYNNIPWANDRSSNFSGYVDKFFIFKNAPLIYSSSYGSGIFSMSIGRSGYFENVCSTTGFFIQSGFSSSGVTGFSTNFFSITETGVTGFVTGLTGTSYSGVTGYANQSVGFFSDGCNNQIEIFTQRPLSGLITTNFIFTQGLTGLIINTGFTQTPLTGNVTGSTQIYITGQSCNQIFIPTGEEIFIKDVNYLKSLSFSEISLMSEINKTTDIVECYNENYQNKFLDYNNNLSFNYLDNSFFTNNFFNEENNLTSGILLFSNGQLILDSGFFLRTSGYNTFIVPNIDYYRTGKDIFVEESININDNIFYDFISGDQEIIGITGISSGSQLVGKNFNNKFVFINGQKLVSGVTYTGINTVNITIPSGRNYIFIKSVPFLNYVSGNISTLQITGQNLNKNSTQVYLNGIKQKIDSNYVENSNFDLLSGDWNENRNNFIIYNNTDDFFV